MIDMSEIVIGDHIGRGGFGSVYQAKWRSRTVAVKVSAGNLISSSSREVEILKRLPRHPNIITFFGVALSSDRVSTCIVTELATNSSLFQLLHQRKERLSADQRSAWALQVACGMQHLHAHNVVHRDLKSANILLSLGLVAKVCDFGTARTLVQSVDTTLKGTYRWMATEIMQGVEGSINKMYDVFSYGMVLYEIYSCKIPFEELLTDPLVSTAVLEGQRRPLPPSLPLPPLLQACWEREPNKRPLFRSIVLAIQTECFEQF